jgi:MFS family permease
MVKFTHYIGNIRRSVYNKPIEKLFPEWGTGSAAITFSLGVAMLGSSAAFFGAWLEVTFHFLRYCINTQRNGPRIAGIIASICFAVGLQLAALGVHTGQLWLLYVGYGIVGGLGIGIGYITPVSALVKWFPDRKGTINTNSFLIF